MEALRQKVAQMFIVGCQGECLSRDEQLIFEEHGFGGLILFSENCCAPEQIASLCRTVWNTAPNEPPFLAIDQEGGRVHRLPPPFTHFPPATMIGAKKNPDLAYRCGRAFGAEPEQVIDISLAWMRGLRDGGIIPCGKHFPGHGDTEEDSHLALPIVDKSLDEIKAVELPPFANACRSGIEALMTAHVRFTALDSDLPATLSQRVVTEVLRHQLGYDGRAFSNDMGM